MNFATAIGRVTHYVQENPATFALTTTSLATMACPTLVTAVVFSAAGLAANGPVAGVPSRSSIYLVKQNLITDKGAHLLYYSLQSVERPQQQQFYKAQRWADMVLPSSM